MTDPIENHEGRLKKFEDEKAETDRNAELVAAQRELDYYISVAEDQFEANTQDYGSAVDFLKNAKTEELILAGEDRRQIPAIIAHQFRTMSSNAFNTGKNPAEVLYKIAGNYGYTKTANEEHEEIKKDNALEEIDEGQKKASKKLPKGGTVKKKLTAAGLLELEGDEFDAKWDEMFG